MPSKSKDNARARAPEKNDAEVKKLLASLESEIDIHTQEQKSKEKKTPFTTSLRIARLAALRPWEGGKIFNVEVDGTTIRASSIDNRLMENMSNKKKAIVDLVLITIAPRAEILVSLSDEQAKKFTDLGLVHPSRPQGVDTMTSVVDGIFESPDMADNEIDRI